MAQSLDDEMMEELIQNNLGITYELLNQLDNAISCYTLVRQPPLVLLPSPFNKTHPPSIWAWRCKGET